MKLVNLLIVLFLALLVVNCGKKTVTETSTPAADTSGSTDNSIRVIASALSLPDCSTTIEGRVYYIQSDHLFKYCDSAQTWTVIDLTGPSGMTGTILVSDSTGQELGTLVDHLGYRLTLRTPKNYFYQLSIAGTPVPNVGIYFSDSGCTIPLKAQMSANYWPSDWIMIAGNGNLYLPSSIASNGTANASDVSISGYIPNLNTGSCDSTGGTAWVSTITATTRIEVGIPTTITPPFTFTSAQ